ncbi:MAG: fimbrillin family protein [Odoribacter sp.]|nr:fimbrillin family protein [Odoribacter sp.]
MRKTIFKSTILAALSIAALSCSNNSNQDETPNISEPNENKTLSDQAVVIETGISTRVVDTNWESGDAIGVSMYNPTYTAIISGQVNKEYTTTSNSTVANFTGATAGDVIYFPQDGSAIRIRSYYPYRAGIENNDMQIAMNVTNQSVLQNIDLMTAEHQSGFTKTDGNVRLHFYHRMASLIFNLTVSDEIENLDLSQCTLVIRNAQEADTYNLNTDAFLNLTPTTGNITVPTRTGENPNYRQAIVLPRPAAEGIIFEFTDVNGGTYIAYMSSTLALKGGNRYIFNITLSRNAVTVTADIEPWIENPAITHPAQ